MAELTLREAAPDDAEACGPILYEAFSGIAERSGFPEDFESEEFATGVIWFLVSDENHFGVVAERDGEIVGSNFLDERDPIRGVGPISVSPRAQSGGVGRRLMEAVIERARGAPGTRLLQDAHNPVSMSLYTSLGFDVKEPIVRILGIPMDKPAPGFEVHPLESSDVPACEDICRRVHGFERTQELEDALEGALITPIGVVREGRITGYATSVTRWALGHTVAEREDDLRALVLGAHALTGEPVDFLLPTREAALFRWCLEQGLQVVKPMTLMAMGAYQKPLGAWLPSVIY